MKTSPAIILDIRNPRGQFWARVRIGQRQWQRLESRAKVLGVTVLEYILDQSERRANA